MSFVRFGKDSDVYVYQSCNSNLYVCCWCILKNPDCELDDEKWPEDFECDTREEMIEHLKEHEEAGHKVPVVAFERLRDPDCL